MIDEYKSKNEVFVNNTNKDTIYEIHNGKLPVELTDYTAELRKAVWDSMLLSSPSHLTFKMIMRLAELLVSCNPYVKRYLQQTYSYISPQINRAVNKQLYLYCYGEKDTFYNKNQDRNSSGFA